MPAAAAAPSIVIDGQPLSSDVPALAVGDHVLVPLRGVFEAIGAAVSYDARRRIAVVGTTARTVEVPLNGTLAIVAGRRVALDVPAREVAGRIEVPLRFVAQSLGAAVDYDTQTNSVIIVSGGKQGNFVAAVARQSGGQVAAAVSQAAPTIEDERPESGSLIGSQYPQIYARFNGGTSAVDPSTVRVDVDGVDVTDASTISSAYIGYTPQSGLASGAHTVSISGQADDGAAFSDRWSFRIDAGEDAEYPSSYGGFYPAPLGFADYGFYPPGFSLFAPGQLYYVAGNIIEIVFFSHFFPYGSGFFTIGGIPGAYPLQPWSGFPGYYRGALTVPYGAVARAAVVSAHFESKTGRTFVVHATAPLTIDGKRRALPRDLRFAVVARPIAHPTSPHRMVVFKQSVALPTFEPIAQHQTASRTPRDRTLPAVRRLGPTAPALRALTLPAVRWLAPAAPLPARAMPQPPAPMIDRVPVAHPPAAVPAPAPRVRHPSRPPH